MKPRLRDIESLDLIDVGSTIQVVGFVAEVDKPVPRPTLAAFSCHQCRNETLVPKQLSEESPQGPEECLVKEGGCGALSRVVGADYIARHSILSTVQEIRLRSSSRSPRVIAVLSGDLIGKASRRMRVELLGKVVLRNKVPTSDRGRSTLVIMADDIRKAPPGPPPATPSGKRAKARESPFGAQV